MSINMPNLFINQNQVNKCITGVTGAGGSDSPKFKTPENLDKPKITDKAIGVVENKKKRDLNCILDIGVELFKYPKELFKESCNLFKKQEDENGVKKNRDCASLIAAPFVSAFNFFLATLSVATSVPFLFVGGVVEGAIRLYESGSSRHKK